MGIFDGLMSWGSSVLNTVSSFASTVFAPIVNTFTGGGNSGGGGGNSGGGGGSSSGGSGSWVSSVQRAFNDAVTQATKQVEQITSSLNDTLSGIGKGFDDLGKGLDELGKNVTAGLPKIFDAEKTLADAQKQFDQLIKAGGDIPANLQKQFDDAKKQVEQKKKEIKTQTDTYAKGLVQKAEAAAAAATPLDIAKTALMMNPVTVPIALGAAAGQNVINNLLGGSNALNPDKVSINGKADPNLLYNLDYSNPNVQFYSSEVDSQGNKKSTGYLGQYAKPFAVSNDAVMFNTGGIRGGSNAPADMSSWTDTPDSQKLHDYGLSGSVVYTSRDLDAAEQAKLLETYKAKGWLPTGGKTVTERAAAAVEKVPVTTDGNKVVYKGVGGGGIGSGLFTAANGKTYDLNNPATALNVVADAIGGAPAAASGFMDTAINIRDDAIGGTIQNIMTGNIADPTNAFGASALAVDIALPLDLMNVGNLILSGRADQITWDLAAVAALDAIALAAFPLTGGAGYFGVKALKTAAKGAKIVGYGGQVGLGAYGFAAAGVI